MTPQAPPSDTAVFSRRDLIEAPLNPERYTVLRRLFSEANHKVVVGLGGGALPGLCGNIALARILEELSLRSHVAEIWGTSAGAVVGGGWATGTDALETLDLVRGMHTKGAVDFSLLRFAAGILASLWPFRRPLPDGLIRGDVFWQTIDQGLKVKTFDECPTPFRCIACTDDGRASRKIFRRGQLLPAIFSSMSIPGVVIPRPGDDEGNHYYDGGLVEKSPMLSPIAEHLRSGDKRKLVLVVTHFGNEIMQTAAQGFYHRFMHTLYAMEELCWDYQLAETRLRSNVDLVLLNPRLQDSALFKFEHTDMNYLAARERFADLLQNAKIAQTFGLA
ncbi:MAG: patatin-like phospholipase family protein [Planctomycetota bacterium]|jgi:predicted acylesterase/phospholipase RssA